MFDHRIYSPLFLFFVALLGLLALFSCGSRPPIPEKKLEDYYYRLAMTNGMIYSYPALEDSFRRKSLDPYFHLRAAEGISQEDIRACYAYYIDRPKKFDKLIERVLVRLQMEEAKLKQQDTVKEGLKSEGASQ